MRILLTISAALLLATAGWAQYPGGGYGGYTPGYGGFPGTAMGGLGNYPGLYGGGLSPFLNLRRGNNLSPAVNYFNFVRPFTGGVFGNAILPGAPMVAPGGTRFFSTAIPPYVDDDLQRQSVDQNAKPDENGLIPVEMPPAGHPAGFNNTMGYFGTPSAALGRPTATPRRR